MAQHAMSQSRNEEDHDVVDVRCSCGWAVSYSRSLGMAEATWFPSADRHSAGRHALNWPPPPAGSNGSS